MYKYVYIHKYTVHIVIIMKQQEIQARKDIHMPRLDTILMVEELVSKAGEFASKNKLWRTLPRQVQYPTFVKIIDYLEASNKIICQRDGYILWISTDNPKLKRLHKTSTRLK